MSYSCVTAPSGLGIWVAYADRLGGYPNAAEQIRQLGFKVVYPRAGDAGNPDKHWTQEACKALLNAGLQVYPWRYSRAGKSNWMAELKGYQRDLDWGASGIVVDAEAHWANAHEQAHLFVDELLDLQCFVADAPWSHIAYHPEYPDAFARLHARMPQLYWTEHNSLGAKRNIAKITQQWQAWEAKKREEEKHYLIKPRWPIGVTYGNQELRKLGVGKCPGDFYLQDLIDFMNAYQDTNVSLYSLEAASPIAIGHLRALASAQK